MTYSPNNFGIVTPAGALNKSVANNTGSTVTKATPVSATVTGITGVDVTDPVSSNSVVGVVNADIANSTTGTVVSSGVVENITTSASYGDSLYVATDGTLTNQFPQIGVNGFAVGDWIIKIGVVSKNTLAPSQKDLIVLVQVIGEL